MFWDTVEFWTDDDETKEKKKHRRKSNYYEKKVDNLDDILEDINNKIKTLETYNLDTLIRTGEENDVYAYGYKNYKKKLYNDMNTMVTDYKDKKSKIKTVRDTLQQRRQSHYNKGV